MICRCCLLLAISLSLRPCDQLLAQPVPDADTLLLAQFEDSTDADYSIGNSSSSAKISRSGWCDGRFGRAIHLAAGDSVSYSAADGNFRPETGTIEFWICPDWDGGDGGKRSFLTMRLGDTGYMYLNKINPTRLGVALAAGEGDDWRWRRADVDASGWKSGEWHHLAFTWGGGRLRVFADGRCGERTADDAVMPRERPDKLELVGCDAIVDGLRILGREFDEEDARESIRLALHPPYRRFTALPWRAEGRVTEGGLRLLGNRRIPLLLGQTRYGDGFACEGDSQIELQLVEQYAALDVAVGSLFTNGRPLGTAASAPVRVEVWGDDRVLYQGVIDAAATAPSTLRVSLAGVKHLRLRTLAGKEAGRRGTVVWANPVLLREADFRPTSATWEVAPEELEMYRRQMEADDFSFPRLDDESYLLANKDWLDEVDPSARPERSQIGVSLRAMATPGEYEPVSFAVYSFIDLDDVTVRVSDLRGESSTLPSTCVDVRLVLRGLMRDLYTLPPHRSTVVSRFLLPQQEIDIPSGTFREFHLTVHVPDDTAPGMYRGVVRVEPSDADFRECPIEVEVLPFRLGDPGGKSYGMYYRFPAADQDWSGVPVELADLRAHGVSMLKSNLGVEFRAADDQLVPSFASLRRGLDLLREHGFRGPLPVGSGADRAAAMLGYDVVNDYDDLPARQRYLAIVKRAMQELVELNREYSDFELLPTHMDEVFGRDRLNRYNRLSEAVRQVPSLRLYITIHNDPKRDVSEMMQRLDPFVDVRCYNGHCMDNYIQAGNTFADLQAELGKSGDEAWLYHNIRGAFFPAEWMRLINGFYLWNSPLRIHTPWIYYSYQGNPFDATDGPYERGGDFAYAVPDPKDASRMVPTRHWEAFREGVDDQRYLAKLESLVAAQPASPAVVEARKWLDGLSHRVTPTHEELQAITLESPLLVALARRWDAAQYCQFRREAADFIVRLMAP